MSATVNIWAYIEVIDDESGEEADVGLPHKLLLVEEVEDHSDQVNFVANFLTMSLDISSADATETIDELNEILTLWKNPEPPA
jgi:hypothetical protein